MYAYKFLEIGDELGRQGCFDKRSGAVPLVLFGDFELESVLLSALGLSCLLLPP